MFLFYPMELYNFQISVAIVSFKRPFDSIIPDTNIIRTNWSFKETFHVFRSSCNPRRNPGKKYQIGESQEKYLTPSVMPLSIR